jgi:hypothetical protein
MDQRDISALADETIGSGLWNFPPEIRPVVLSERRKRNILQGDPEPVGDPEFS